MSAERPLSARGNWRTDLSPERANNQRVNRSPMATQCAPELTREIRSFHSAGTATNGESLARRMRTVDGFKTWVQRTRILTITGGVCDIGNALKICTSFVRLAPFSRAFRGSDSRTIMSA